MVFQDIFINVMGYKISVIAISENVSGAVDTTAICCLCPSLKEILNFSEGLVKIKCKNKLPIQVLRIP